jgi:hypothetical protein
MGYYVPVGKEQGMGVGRFGVLGKSRYDGNGVGRVLGTCRERAGMIGMGWEN